eukprot:11130281-Alexandrium_andersonii.AAC.1
MCIRDRHGPKNGLNIGPRSSPGVRPAPFFRADSESADEASRRVRQGRLSGEGARGGGASPGK